MIVWKNVQSLQRRIGSDFGWDHAKFYARGNYRESQLH